MWVEGVVEGGEYLRKSLKTKSWERAQVLSKALEESPEKSSETKAGPVTIEHAVTEYLADGKARELADATVYKLDITFRKQFLTWCKAEGYKLLRELDLGAMRAFRNTWKDGAMAKKKKQERFTGFFWFCIRAGWITENPTANLGRISANQAPTDYFPKDEFKKIIDATYVYQNRAQVGVDNSTRLRTLVLLMRWSGLAIRDAITLEKSKLVGDSVMLYRAKTGTPVFVPLPPHVAEDLRNLPEGPAPKPTLPSLTRLRKRGAVVTVHNEAAQYW
jgi:integrase/recombinase XerD